MAKVMQDGGFKAFLNICCFSRFTCPGDGDPVGPGHHGWLHWFNHPIPDGGRPNIDLWPDVSSYSPSELFPVPGLTTKTGDPVFLFSSRNAKTVQRYRGIVGGSIITRLSSLFPDISVGWPNMALMEFSFSDLRDNVIWRQAMRGSGAFVMKLGIVSGKQQSERGAFLRLCE